MNVESEMFEEIKKALSSVGVVKRLASPVSAAALKEEIQYNGPVLSLGFQLSESFLKANPSVTFLRENRLGKCHPILIIGWRVCHYGEAWVVAGSYNEVAEEIGTFEVAIDQYGVLNNVVTFENHSLDIQTWQSGPYFSRDFTKKPAWRLEQEMELEITESELRSLLTCIAKGPPQVESVEIEKLRGQAVCVHEHELKAKSERFKILGLSFKLAEKKWELSLRKLE